MSIFYNIVTSLNLDPAALGSIESMPAADETTAPIKHRACDECRTRKLACSKDPDGCERCKKEGIRCHYSEQKPMGRPRKRQFIESTEPNPSQDSHPREAGAMPYVVGDLNAYNKNGSLNSTFVEGLMEASAPLIYGQKPKDEAVWNDGSLLNWKFGSTDIIAGPPIEIGNTATSPADTNSSNEHYLTPPDAGVSPAAPTSCSCLASMYLALSSLQQLPTDIVVALKTVRTAAQTAASCIWCPICGYVMFENPNPPIESFQNTMLLGTLLPIIANAYQRLLVMIDDETNAAEVAGTTKPFRFQDYGGLCPKHDSPQIALACVAKELLFDPVEMPPHQWRTTVRALLRVDIYGHEQGDFRHKGLRDLVNDMESRQRARHEIVDAATAAGITIGGHGLVGKDCNFAQPGATHTCLQILNIAKIAIDNLVIA